MERNYEREGNEGKEEEYPIALERYFDTKARELTLFNLR